MAGSVELNENVHIATVGSLLASKGTEQRKLGYAKALRKQRFVRSQ